MYKRLIIVTGYVAAGKTTFSHELSKELNVPVFCKDLLKIELGRDIPVNNREDSKKLSYATFNALMYILKSFMVTGKFLILESNFRVSEGEIIRGLAEKYDYEILTYLFTANLEVLHKRFLDRENSPERDKVNRVNGLLDNFSDFKNAIKPLEEFSIGNKIVKIDTTNFETVNFDNLKKIGLDFYNNKENRGIIT